MTSETLRKLSRKQMVGVAAACRYTLSFYWPSVTILIPTVPISTCLVNLLRPLTLRYPQVKTGGKWKHLVPEVLEVARAVVVVEEEDMVTGVVTEVADMATGVVTEVVEALTELGAER